MIVLLALMMVGPLFAGGKQEAAEVKEGPINIEIWFHSGKGEEREVLNTQVKEFNYAWAGHLIPLDPYVLGELKADLLPSILAQGIYGGKLYALGTFDSGLAIWGNKAYLEKAGVRIPKGIEDA